MPFLCYSYSPMLQHRLVVAPRSGIRRTPNKRHRMYGREYSEFLSYYLSLDGLRYHFLEEGQGEPLLMVHGNPTWSFMYRRLVRDFRHRYRVVVPDHIGCGLSDKPAAERYSYRLESRIDDLEALCLARGLTADLTLVLHDWGGLIGLGLAQRHPSWVGRLVLLNTAAFRLPSGKELPWFLRFFRDSQLAALLVQGCNAFAWISTYAACRQRPMTPQVRASYLAPYDSWAHRLGVLKFVQDIPLGQQDPSYSALIQIEDSLDELRSLPILICWGMRDPVFDADFLEEWQRRFPEAEVHAFQGAGHYVLEDVGHAISPLMSRFLERNPLP